VCSSQVVASPREVCPLLNGMSIPQASLVSAAGEPFDLNAAIKSRPALLVFYRGGW
jgi:hypothetical protein